MQCGRNPTPPEMYRVFRACSSFLLSSPTLTPLPMPTTSHTEILCKVRHSTTPGRVHASLADQVRSWGVSLGPHCRRSVACCGMAWGRHWKRLRPRSTHCASHCASNCCSPLVARYSSRPARHCPLPPRCSPNRAPPLLLSCLEHDPPACSPRSPLVGGQQQALPPARSSPSLQGLAAQQIKDHEPVEAGGLEQEQLHPRVAAAAATAASGVPSHA